MDEVRAMSHAGETVGRAMGTGLRTVRRGAVGVSHAGVEAAARAAVAAERKLAEAGQELTVGTSPARRRWPWLVALLGIVAAAATATVLRGRSSSDPAPVDQSDDPDAAEQGISRNGIAPQPRTEQAERKEFDRKN